MIDNQYRKLVKTTLEDATYKENRTGVATLSNFSYQYQVDLQEGFPLLTTKDLSGFRWNSLIHELIWYLSGEEHIRNLREETGIWDAWADERGQLETSYGRFWRRYPLPSHRAEGEAWVDSESKYVDHDEETFDQIQYAIDQLQDNPSTRRIVINAWHPANAAPSTLPPCHFAFVLNVQGDRLNCHLTQRSGDIALGIPFNIACYSILTHLFANQVDGLQPGSFSHSIVDAHIYCGAGERGEWYKENLQELKAEMDKHLDYSPRRPYSNHNKFKKVRSNLMDAVPPEPEDREGQDHVPGLLKQLTRESREMPSIEIDDEATVDSLSFDDIELSGYNPHPGISFAVAE
jgi:thymidylate synthase